MGGAGVAGVPDSASASPFLKALTATTVVLASGLKAVFMVSSHASAVGAGAGAGAAAATVLSPLPHPEVTTAVAAVTKSAARLPQRLLIDEREICIDILQRFWLTGDFPIWPAEEHGW